MPVHGDRLPRHPLRHRHPLGYLQTVVQIAAERDDLGAGFRAWLADFVASDSPGGAQ